MNGPDIVFGDRPVVPLSQPRDQRFAQSRLTGQVACRVAQVAAPGTLTQCLRDHLGGREVHIGDPQRQDIFAVVRPTSYSFWHVRTRASHYRTD